MATTLTVLRTCGLLFFLILQVHNLSAASSNSTIQSIQVGSVLCDKNTCKYLLSVIGGEFLGHKAWRLTPEEGAKGSSCEIIYPNYELKENETSQWFSRIEVSVPNIAGKIYFCLRETSKKTPFRGSWMHQGVEYYLEPTKDVRISQNNYLTNMTESNSNTSQEEITNTQMTQNLEDFTLKNETQEVETNWTDLTHDIDVNYLPNVPRPTREEKNDIEVLVNHEFIPLNDLIKQLEGDSKKSIDFLEIQKENDIDNIDFVSDDNRETIALNSNVNNKEEYVDYERFDYAKEIIDKIDLVLSKLQSSESKQILLHVINGTNETGNIFNDTSFIYNKADLLSNNIIPMDTISSSMPYKKIQADVNLNEAYEKVSPIKILEKLDQLLAKIQSIKCSNLQEVSFNMHSTGMHSSEMLSTNTDSAGLHSSGMHSPDVPSTNINSPDLHSFDLHLPYTHSPEVPSTNMDLKELRSFEIPLPYLDPKDLLSIGMHSPGMHSSSMHSVDSPNEDFFKPQELRKKRTRRQVSEVPFSSVRAAMNPITIEGIRIEDSDKEPKIIEEGIPSVLADSLVTLRVYGEGLTERTVIAFTHDRQPYGQPCKFLLKGEYMVKEGSLQHKTALFDVYAPAPITGSKLYICAKNLHPERDTANDEEKYLHQGVETWKMMASHTKLLPLWFSICLILFCLMFSALFSGLNLGLMSLDRTELKIISNTGTEQERKYARAIMPVRDHGNYLLCSILLGNVAVNSTFTILLDELTSGLFAVIFSTLAIVMLGEITPQAICSRHGLMVGAKSIMVTKGVMAVTAPLSFPVSKLLDYFLGEEIGNVYNRERLKELVKVTFLSQVTTDVNDLDKDEVNIISGALEMRKKTVKDVMTKLEDVFMLPISSVLDFETMSEIVKSGYSRIPVYEGGRGNIVTVLFIKDLAFVDPDDNTPLRTLCQYYQNAAHFVFEDVTLDVMFKQFKDGHKGHMAFVHRINNEGEGDPFYETIGLVTLEDVIEEMIQSEIVDETDVFLDNRSKRRRRPQNKLQDFAAFAERHENQRIHISPQLTLATFQFLSTSVDAFRPDTVSETVLRRLLRQDVIQHIKVKEKSKRDPHTYVFQQGKPVDYFVLVLEGRVEVTVGRENLVFEAGPFTYFGVQALTQNIGVAESPTPSAMGSLQNINMDAMLRHTFVPDYSVRAITSVFYLTVKRSLYLAAKRATLMEKGNISKGGTTQEFDTEVDKNLCNSSSANLPISMISKKLFGKSTSTVSTREDALSSTSGVKPPTRLNIIELMQVTQQNYPSSERVDVSDKYLKRVNNTLSITDPDKLLQSVDEDLSLTGEHKTPSRQVSPHPMPVSPAPRSIDARNGHAYVPTHRNSQSDEQERLLK